MADTEISHGSRPMPEFVKKGLIRVSGNLHLRANYAVLWFREDHPDFTIQTEILQHTEELAVVKASIADDLGRILATGHKSTSRRDFPAGYLEKAETGAVARALSFLGYGTEFGTLEESGMEAPMEPAAMAKRSAPPVEPEAPILATQIGAIKSLCATKGVEVPTNLEAMTQAQAAQLLTTLQKKSA